MTDRARGSTEGILQEERTDDAAAWLVQRTARLLRVLFQRLVDREDAGVTPEMWMVLARLLTRDGRSQTEIGTLVFRDRPNTSRIVSGLEERGLVAREVDVEDRRRTLVYLTDAGRALVEETTPAAAVARDRIYAGLGRDEMDTFRRVLRAIESNALDALRALDAGQDAVTREAPPPARPSAS
jgi:DNA-binding MarR family transcriptional regulator